MSNISNPFTQIIDFHSAQEWNELNAKYPDKLIIVTFYTNTCPICKAFAPNFTAAQKDFGKKQVIFGRINADEIPMVSGQLGIQGVPTTLSIKDKEIIHRFSGNYSKPQLRSLINDLLVKYFKQKPLVDDADLMFM
jgi:thioredoxin-like negative regulator of GroEL